MEFRTCWKQYTPLKLRFVGGIIKIAPYGENFYYLTYQDKI